MNSNQFEWIISLLFCICVIGVVSMTILIMELSDTQKDIKAIKEKLNDTPTNDEIVQNVKEYEQILLRWIQRSPDMAHTQVTLGEIHLGLREAIYGKINNG